MRVRRGFICRNRTWWMGLTPIYDMIHGRTSRIWEHIARRSLCCETAISTTRRDHSFGEGLPFPRLQSAALKPREAHCARTTYANHLPTEDITDFADVHQMKRLLEMNCRWGHGSNIMG